MIPSPPSPETAHRLAGSVPRTFTGLSGAPLPPADVPATPSRSGRPPSTSMPMMFASPWKYLCFAVAPGHHVRHQVQDLLARQLVEQALRHDRGRRLLRSAMSDFFSTSGSAFASGFSITFTTSAFLDDQAGDRSCPTSVSKIVGLVLLVDAERGLEDVA